MCKAGLGHGRVSLLPSGNEKMALPPPKAGNGMLTNLWTYPLPVIRML